MGYVIAPRAETDLDEIWLYIARESGSADLADRLLDSVADGFLQLARFPHLGRRRDEISRSARTFVVHEYVVVYVVEDGDVLILRVVHGRRDLDSLFGPQ
jgi:toxin ParE1/3/4